MSESLCPCCELLGKPPGRVNFILITGLPWNSIRYRIRRWLLGRGTDGIHINNRVDLTEYQSLARIDEHLFKSTNSSLSKKFRTILPAQNCCHGYSLLLLEGFGKTDSFDWDQFKEDILCQLEATPKAEDNIAGKRTEPVSWVVIDDKKCMERDHLNFFLQLKDDHRSIVSYTFTIICVIGDETQLFQNCIVECVNSHEYESSVYPDYQQRLQDFLKNFNASSTLQDRTLFIEQSEGSNSEKLRALLFDLPTKVSEYGTRKESFQHHVKNMLSPCRRTVHDINVFRSDARKKCEKVAIEKVQSVFSSLKNSTTAESAVHKIARTVLIEFKSMSTEQRRIYEQKLICGLDPNDAKQSRTIAAELIRYAIRLISEPENTAMSLIYDIVLIICTLGKHRHFCHELFNYTSDIFILSMSLVCQRQYVLVLAGLRLCQTILNADRVEHKYAITYLRYDQLASRKMMDAIEWLLMPYRALKVQWKKEDEGNDSYDQELPSKVEESQCLQHTAILVSHKYIQCLGSLLYGSVEHCAQITVGDVNRLVDTIDTLVDNRLSRCTANEKPFTLMLVSDLCIILYPILQYGLSEVVLTLRCQTSLLKAIPETIRFLLYYGKEFVDPCIRFYTTLMRSLFKDWKVAYVTETEQFITLPIINTVESTTLPNTERTEPKLLTRDTTLNLNQDLISSYFELNREYQDILLQEEKPTIDEAEKFLNIEWEKLNRMELKLDHARLKEENESKQQEISQLHDKLERTRSERDQLHLTNIELIRLMNESRLLSVAASRVPSQPSALPDSTTERNEESMNIGLENLLPHHITREQAESFIQDIYHRRMTFNDHDMRKSICGSLKHLGSDLYSSPVHFLHELIQNAEDNIYASTVTPRLRIVIDHDFILLSNNEQGLRASDVSAICSLAVSTKQLKEHIGEKGVGFKSVFAASNQPTLISHAWKFAFHIPGPDQLSYITPLWISDDTIPAKIRGRTGNEPLDTYLYLPLKLHPFTPEGEEFLDQVAQATDPCILINLRRLEKLEIVDERKSQTLIVTKKVIVMEQNQWQDCTTFEGFTFTNLTESLVQLESGSKQNSFRVYTANIIIPTIIEHRDTTTRTTRIVLAFPCDPEYKLAYNVYAGLPVCNLGFNFLFNADFQLVTNRESIRENVPLNEFIRNHLSVLFVYLLLNDNNIRENMNHYCPSGTNNQIKNSPWWLRMVDRINDLITKHFSKLLNIHSGKSIRRFNVDLALLVSTEQLFDCADIQIIDKEDCILTDERLKTFQVKHVSVLDVIDCFPNQENQSNESRQKFWHWAQEQNVDWWSKFYQHIDQSMTDELGSLLLKKPIFLFQTDSHRQYLPAYTATSRGRYVSDNLSLHMWKRELILLRYTSQWERSALLKSKQVQLLTDERLIQIILYDHLQISLSSITTDAAEIQVEEVWQDLAYLKSKIDIVNKSDRFLVPVRGPSLLVPIQDATLPTILGVNIQDVLQTSHTHVIRFPYYQDSVHDNLIWEHFFLCMNCQKPMIQLSADCGLAHLPVLRSFMMFTNIKLAEEIFSNQSADTQACLRQFPICAYANGQEQIYPVSATFNKTIINDVPYLPQIDVPSDCRSLAKMLGVICDYDLRACVTVLQVLSDQKNTDLVLYIHWLGHLQLYVRQQRTECHLIEALSSCHIYLPDHQQFRSLKDLLVVQDHTEHRTSIELVSEYLNLPVISPSINQIYWQCKDLFDVLNCTCAVSLSHLFQTIHLASRDERNFYALGDGKTVLKDMGVEKMITLYQHLETLILKCVIENKTTDTLHDAIVRKRHPTAPCGSREDWEWRFGMTCTNVSAELRTLIGLDIEHDKLPLLTSSRELVINTDGTTIYACMEQKIIENLAKDSGKRFFISPLITNTCPLVLAALDIDYVERRGKVCWIHKNNNTEQVLEEVTDIFRDTLDDHEIEVVTAKYTNVVLWLSDLSLLNSNNEDPQSNVDSYTFDSDFPFWIFKKVVFLSIGTIRGDSSKSMIATSALATLLHKRKLIPIEMAKSIAQQKIHKCISFSSKKLASVASTGPQYYSYIDIIFPIDNLSIETSAILLGSQFDTEPDSSRNQTPIVTIERQVEDRLYRDRVKQQDHRILLLKNSKKPSDGTIVDYDEQIRIGDNAEHFFFRYLQKEYGINYVTPIANWRSSSRQKLFPGCLRDIDDTVGYDFFLHDKKEIFVKGTSASTKRCYFEVKGIGSSFNVEQTRFYTSENERTMCKTIAFNEQRKETEAYVVVIVEHCLDPENIGLATLINWSENFELIHTSPNSYMCYIVLPSSSDPDKTQEPSPNNQPSKPGPYIPPHRRK